MSVVNISASNESLQFIEERIKSDDYRGLHLFQHYRYDIEFIRTVLTVLHQYHNSTGNKYLKIRTTDSSKRPENNLDEADYSRFVSTIKATTGKGTQDAIRKIIFVDCNRMGFLDRYDKNKTLVAPDVGAGHCAYVSLSERGQKLVEAANVKEEYFIFSSGLYRIVGPLIQTLKTLITDYGLVFITKFEFMYFVSAVDDDSTFLIDVERCAYLIKQFRLLGDIDRKNVTRLLKQEMNPKNYSGNKKEKRDFHNWENEATQTFLLLATTVYFEVRNRIKLMLNGSDTSLEAILGKEFKKQRSLQQKTNYYEQHEIASKTLGFELHHVVALEHADSPALYKLLDDWRNLAYIDALSHAKITQNRNRNVVMSAEGEDLVLSDYSDGRVHLISGENILYSVHKQSVMLDYNSDLLHTVH